MTTSDPKPRRKYSANAVGNALTNAASKEKVDSMAALYRKYAGLIDFLREDLNQSWGDVVDALKDENVEIGVDTLRVYRSKFMKNAANKLAVETEVERLREERQAMRANAPSLHMASPRLPGKEVSVEARPAPPFAPSATNESTTSAASEPHRPLGEWNELEAVAEAIRLDRKSGEPLSDIVDYRLADGSAKRIVISVQRQDQILDGDFDTLEQARR